VRWNESHLARESNISCQQRAAARRGGVDGEGWHAQRNIQNNACWHERWPGTAQRSSGPGGR
jgi:hypothetical protein